MFRSNKDNRFYSEPNKPQGCGAWYVFYYDLQGEKVRQRAGPDKRTAEVTKGDIEHQPGRLFEISFRLRYKTASFTVAFQKNRRKQ